MSTSKKMMLLQYADDLIRAASQHGHVHNGHSRAPRTSPMPEILDGCAPRRPNSATGMPHTWDSMKGGSPSLCHVNRKSWVGEMAQRLRTLIALLKALSSNPSNHMVAHNHL
uniref:Uncharacterized protein n=1 Tax=Mus musculus TaxID=10090 RepID=Q3TYN7_MOUSE|nr:unnamed protein product [Mus musculus]